VAALIESAAIFVLFPASAGTGIISTDFFAHGMKNIIKIMIKNKIKIRISQNCDLAPQIIGFRLLRE